MVENFPMFHHFFTITIADLKEETKIFNSFFVKQYSLIDNGSTLPSLFPLKTDKLLPNVNFVIEDIKVFLSKLDSSKVHGDDMMSICILNL